MKSVCLAVAWIAAAAIVVSLTSYILIVTGGQGSLLIGLALPIGFVCSWGGRTRSSLFCGGFVVSGMVASLAYACLYNAGVEAVGAWPATLFERSIVLFPFLVDLCKALGNLRLLVAILSEVSCGLPVLAVASLGGFMTVVIAGKRPVPRIHTVHSTIRRLVALVACLAVILGAAMAAPQWRHCELTVRVFNNTRTPLTNLSIGHSSLKPGRGIGIFGDEAPSEGISTSETLRPGEMIRWATVFPGHSEFVFFGTTPGGAVESGRAKVNVSEISPLSLDFYVEPTGVRSVVVPRP